MFTITKEFSFEACHCLTHLPADHPCSRPHGHSYRFRVELQSEGLNPDGFVEDYRNLVDANALAAYLDHQDLNQLLPFATTAENIAFWLFGKLYEKHPKLTAVAVSETQKTWAEYRDDS